MKRLSFLVLAATMSMASAFAEDPYIESLGTSGILTGYRMKGGISRVEVDFQLTTTENSGQTWAFGTDANENTLRTFMYFTGTGVGATFMFRVRGGANVNTGATDPELTTKTGDRGWNHEADTDRHVLIVDLKNGRDQIKTGGNFSMNQSFDPNLLTNLTADLPLSLFARYGNNRATAFERFCKAKIYGVKIYENDVLVRDFVPCKKEGVTPCFKDLVEGGFIVPENPAAFEASDNAPTYQDNAYVSTAANANGGKLYIDTGYVIGDNTCVALDCAMEGDLMNGSYVNTTLWYLFDGTPSSGQRFEFNFGALSHAGCLRWSAAGTDFYAATNWWRAAFPPATAANDFRKLRRTYILGGSGGNVMAAVATCGFTNCTVSATATATYSGSTTLKIASYFSGTSYNTPLRIYGCKIYESGVLVREFVPYVKAGVPGLRESGTGTFSPVLGGSGDKMPEYGGEIVGDDDAYIESNGSTGMSSGYKMKGNISRVEVDYSLTDIYSSSKRIFGDNSANEPNVKTMYYFTGNAGETGGLATFRIVGANNTAHGPQWTITDVPMDLSRRTAIVDLDNGKAEINTETKRSSKNFSNSGSYRKDFEGRVAALPLSLFANYANAAGTTYANSSKARIYSVRFYENYVEGGENTPVRELIPYSRDGVVGFYDTVTGEIVKNDSAAAGAFTFGGAGTDHGALNCYLKPGYATKVKYNGEPIELTAYAPGATSYKWFRDGQLIDDNKDGVADGSDGTLSVGWMRGDTKTVDSFLHAYQAVAVFNLYGVERESEPTAAVEVSSERLGFTIIFK